MFLPVPHPPASFRSPGYPSPAWWLVVLAVAAILGGSAAFYRGTHGLVPEKKALLVPGAPGIEAFWLPENAAPEGYPALTIGRVAELDRLGAFVPLGGPGSPREQNRRINEERWYRITIDNRAGARSDGVLDLILRSYDRSVFYTPAPDGGWQERICGASTSPRDPRQTERWMAFDVELPAGQSLTAYLHVRDYNRLPSRFLYWPNREDFIDRELLTYGQYIAWFSLWGGMLAVAVFFYAMLRQDNQFHYAIFVGLTGLLTWLSSTLGSLLYEWPVPSVPPETVMSIMGCLIMHRLCLFARYFLETPGKDRRLDRRLRRLQAVALWWLLTVVASFWPSVSLAYLQVYTVLVVFFLGTVLWTGVLRWRAGCLQARYLLLAFAPYGMVSVVWMFLATGDATGYDETRMLLLLGTALHLVLLTLATAFRQRALLDENLRMQSSYTASLEKEVEERTRELQQLSGNLANMVGERNRILAVIGHDLRGPASSLQSLTRILADNAESFSREELAGMANEIARACLLQTELLNNLLLWSTSRMEGDAAGGQRVDVREAMADVSRLLEWAGGAKGLSIVNGVPAGLVVQAHPQHLQAILRNLLVNAIKFTPPGGTVIVTAGHSLRGDGMIEIRVRDTGVGIAPERLALLLKAAVKSMPGTNAERGAGIGLTLCSDLARVAGGDIRIESTPGVGTTVAVRLPSVTEK
ncbi:hypothetical protein OPIT5_20815 [Opitutaceae bacterium TAV5]|nr:hypothetical protein OPIT5_20815 [Opitutaceae bacterium TAV5]